jgi:hypothetical protein
MLRTFLLILIFFISPPLNAQQIKQKIEWHQCTNDLGTVEKYKTIVNFDINGNKTAEYFKGEGIMDWEFKSKDYTYDKLGRVIYIKQYNPHGETNYEEIYVYKKNYYTHQVFSGYGDEERFTYFYVNDKKQIVEEKVYSSSWAEEKQTKLSLAKWVILSYNSKGLLIGKRYKNSKAEEISKSIYHYKPNTNLLLKVTDYCWDDKKEKEIIKASICPNRSSYKYDTKNRLVEKEMGCQHGYHHITYEYKNGKIWIEDHSAGIIRTKDIYKDGVLVRTKYYGTDADTPKEKEKHLLGEERLECFIDYQYIYY